MDWLQEHYECCGIDSNVDWSRDSDLADWWISEDEGRSYLDGKYMPLTRPPYIIYLHPYKLFIEYKIKGPIIKVMFFWPMTTPFQ